MSKQKQDDPPLTLVDPDKMMIIFTIIIILTFIAFVWAIGTAKVPEEEQEKQEELGLSSYLIASAPPYNVKGESRATLIERIIWCESRGDPTAQNPKSTAYGICQFIDGTWEYVQEKWDMKLDRDNYYDQYYACERLLKEEGTKHWVESKFCWNK